MRTIHLILLLPALLLLSCGGTSKSSMTSLSADPVGPAFQADSAFAFCERQCSFGPRTMNSRAHDECADWIVSKFGQYGMSVSRQQAVLTGYDGTRLNSTNIIASYRPDVSDRLLLCAHWDSRPWADNDPDEANHHSPVMAANDGASGVAVMLEVARLISADTLSVGVDFVCFDAEDWGTPQWAATDGDDADTWALGAQHWAKEYSLSAKTATYRFGILLDMVGGEGATFYREGMSQKYASNIVNKVWAAAATMGYSSYFPQADGGWITDDHIPVNTKAKIPCIDIIPYYPDCEQSSFGPTWHTVSDDLAHLSLSTLQAVGQTLIQVIYSEQKSN